MTLAAVLLIGIALAIAVTGLLFTPAPAEQESYLASRLGHSGRASV